MSDKKLSWDNQEDRTKISKLRLSHYKQSTLDGSDCLLPNKYFTDAFNIFIPWMIKRIEELEHVNKQLRSLQICPCGRSFIECEKFESKL